MGGFPLTRLTRKKVPGAFLSLYMGAASLAAPSKTQTPSRSRLDAAVGPCYPDLQQRAARVSKRSSDAADETRAPASLSSMLALGAGWVLLQHFPPGPLPDGRGSDSLVARVWPVAGL